MREWKTMDEFLKIDLHMHSNISDGTDTPEELLPLIREEGIRLFSVTDHDSIKSSTVIPALLREGDPFFLPGVEFSCRDEDGKYHILGYGYDPASESMRSVVAKGHRNRMNKVRARLDFLQTRFGFRFPEEELKALFKLDNPGKPHIGNLMVRLGYAKSKEDAIKNYIDQLRIRSDYLRPEEAIAGILGGGGVPVLAHPAYGSGDELIIGEQLDLRVRKLTAFGLRGVEAYYSGFTRKLRSQALSLAERYDLYVTAGSDYHGKNKLVELGDTGLNDPDDVPDGLRRFLERVCPARP